MCGLEYDANRNSTGNDYFISGTCPDCFKKCNQCVLCSKRYFNSRFNDYRPIRAHISNAHEGEINTGSTIFEQNVDVQSDSQIFPEDSGHDQTDIDIGEDYNVDDIQLDEQLFDLDFDSEFTYVPPPLGHLTIELDQFHVFSNRESNVYFWQEYICNRENQAFGGLRGIVWRSSFKRNLFDHTKISSVPDSELLFNMAQHVMSNTEDQNEAFFDILKEIHDMSTGFKTDVTIPFDSQTANEVLKERKFAIFGNLPYEEVKVVEGHACISLVGLIQHMYAHRIPIGWTEQTDVEGDTRLRNNTHGCEAMEELLATMKILNTDDIPTKYGSFLLWSDGFIRSFVKQKDNNVWIMTVTLPDPNGSATSKYHTYCLSIGKSSNDHQPVVDHYLKEIEMLTNGVKLFDPETGKYINVQMGLLAYIADRPERHAILNQAQAGHFGQRTLWCSVVDHKNLPYCKVCFKKEINSLMSDIHSPSTLATCGRCCQWDMKSSSPANKKVKGSEIKTTDKYPTSCDPSSPAHPLHRPVPTSHLRPVELDYLWMVCALRFAAHNVIHHMWNKGTTFSYLKSCAIPDRVTDKLYTRFNKMDPSNDDEGVEVASNEYVPFVWLSIVCIGAWIDAGMHHVFHGVVARIMVLMEDVMTKEDKKTTFEDIANPHLAEIGSLRLDWLHVKTLPKKQWLAEDELGYSRICCFVYGQFFLNVSLRETSNTTKGTWLAMRQMIASMHVMIALLMSPRDPMVSVIDRHIKLFLSCCNRFTHLFYDQNSIPFWATTSNFPSLLNLAAQIKKYGPIRWYWEGTRERYIQTVKKVLVSMRKTTPYFVRKMIILQKLTTMDWMGERIRKESAKEKKDYPRMYFRYESLGEIMDKFKNGDVLSGLTILKNDSEVLEDHFWIVYGKKGSSVSIVPLIRNGDNTSGKQLIGLRYQGYTMSEADVMTGLSQKDLKIHTSAYCVLLPYKKGDEDEFNNMYGVVYSDWDNLDEYGKKNLPKLCFHEFGTDAMEL